MAPGRHLQGEEKVQIRGTVREGVAAVPNSLRHSVWAVTTMEGEGGMSNRLSHILGHLELPMNVVAQGWPIQTFPLLDPLTWDGKQGRIQTPVPSTRKAGFRSRYLIASQRATCQVTDTGLTQHTHTCPQPSQMSRVLLAHSQGLTPTHPPTLWSGLPASETDADTAD